MPSLHHLRTCGYPLVGTAEQIVDELGKLAGIGVDGCLISWVSYKEELLQRNEKVLPLMVQAGLRAPLFRRRVNMTPTAVDRCAEVGSKSPCSLVRLVD
jgi:hypothetical protein